MKNEKEPTELEKDTELWQMLDVLPDEEVRLGFESRFWTRLAEQETWLERLRRILVPSLTWSGLKPALSVVFTLVIVGAAVFYQFTRTSSHGLVAEADPVEFEIAQDLEFARHLDVLEEWEILEDWDIIEDLAEAS